MKETWGRYGQFTLTAARRRFWERVTKTETCWLWNGHRDRNGYGKLSFAGEPWLAHRLALTLNNPGRERPELQALHKCDNPPCCNPKHLYWGTPADNVKDAETRGQARHPAGENHGRAKLTQKDADKIRDLRKDGMAIRAIARLYPQVSRPSIVRIVHGKGWLTK